MTQAARLLAGLIGLVALVALVMQSVVSHRLTGSVGQTLWVMAGYFTILTNILVLLTFAGLALGARMPSARWMGGLTLWILIVGVVYHTLLAQTWDPQGLALWADQGLHTATPLLTLLFWLLFAPTAALGLADSLRWLGWPLLYTLYAMIRGFFTGQYPYPFIDLSVLTPGQVALNSLGLLVAFWVGGLVTIGIAKALPKR